jgi:hypothetical protein
VDESRFDQPLPAVAGGRRDALRSLSAAGIAVLATLGLAQGGDAKNKKKNNGGSDCKDRAQAAKKKGGGKGKPGPTGNSSFGNSVQAICLQSAATT